MSASYRETALACPGCKETLDPKQVGDAIIDVCPACGGIWVDWFDGDSWRWCAARPGEGRAHPRAAGSSACPRCRRPLASERYRRAGGDPALRGLRGRVRAAIVGEQRWWGSIPSTRTPPGPGTRRQAGRGAQALVRLGRAALILRYGRRGLRTSPSAPIRACAPWRARARPRRRARRRPWRGTARRAPSPGELASVSAGRRAAGAVLLHQDGLVVVRLGPLRRDLLRGGDLLRRLVHARRLAPRRSARGWPATARGARRSRRA